MHPPTAANVSPSSDDARLAAALRATAPGYLDDAGFTARVLAALPPPRARSARRRTWLLTGALVLGGLGTAALGRQDLVVAGRTLALRLAQWSTAPFPGVPAELAALLPVGVVVPLAFAALVGYLARGDSHLAD